MDIERPDWPGLSGQTLRVCTGGQTRVLELIPGLERYVVDVPAPASANEPVKMLLIAGRTVPESTARRYRRNLAYMLRGARFEPGF